MKKITKTISAKEALELLNDNKCNLIDIRDIRELQNEGKVEKSQHIPRGMLEFWMDPESVYFKQGMMINQNTMWDRIENVLKGLSDVRLM